MAELAGIAGKNQWRKFTGGAAPRAMSQQMLFYIAAQLTLSKDELTQIVAKMAKIGAQIK